MQDREISVFQRVLEALERAREVGEEALRGDSTTREQDDPDCYPHGLIVTLPRTHEAWKALRFLGKNLDWVSMESRGLLNLRPRMEMKFRTSEVIYLQAVGESLCRDGIDCVPEIMWH